MKFFKIIFFGIIFFVNDVLAQNYQELQKIQSEYKKALDRQSLQKPKSISDAEKTLKSTSLPDKLVYTREDIESLLMNTQKLLERLNYLEDSTSKMPYVAYDFFTKRDSIPFWQNLPITDSYVLGPGDELIISIWGETNIQNSEIIDRDGQVYIDKIGVLNLGGKSVIDAKSYINSRFSKVYSTLKSKPAKSFLDLTLGELKSVNVHVTGHVNSPGVHLVHPFSNIINTLIQAGGVDIKGSLREIRLIRNGKVFDSIDIYDYLLNGNPEIGGRILDQDIIYVPPRKSTIALNGRVLKPGYYEMLEDETLLSVINFAGGFDRFASEYTFLFKRFDGGKSFIINKNDLNKHFINDGDSISVSTKPQTISNVTIEGQVKNPGAYPYYEGMSLDDLLNSTMSLLDEDFTRTMNLNQIFIFRKNDDGKNPYKIVADVNEQKLLKNGDHINIAPSNYFEPIQSVKISGEIKIPGIYPVNKPTTLEQLLIESGGLTDLALEDGIEIFRDSLKIAWLNKDFFLNDGDSLNVLKKTGLVLVVGEVNVPGYVSFKKNNTIDDYIKKAGGLTSFSDKNNIYITYPNGVSRTADGLISSPKVKEGSVITINQRMIGGENRVTGWQAFSMISSQATNIATTLLSLYLLSNQTQ